MSADGAAAMQELRSYYSDCLHMQNDTVSDEHIKQEEHGEDVFMSDSAATSIAAVNNLWRPSSASNSAADGGSVSKKFRSNPRSCTGIERKLLEEQFASGK